MARPDTPASGAGITAVDGSDLARCVPTHGATETACSRPPALLLAPRARMCRSMR